MTVFLDFFLCRFSRKLTVRYVKLVKFLVANLVYSKADFLNLIWHDNGWPVLAFAQNSQHLLQDISMSQPATFCHYWWGLVLDPNSDSMRPGPSQYGPSRTFLFRMLSPFSGSSSAGRRVTWSVRTHTLKRNSASAMRTLARTVTLAQTLLS